MKKEKNESEKKKRETEVKRERRIQRKKKKKRANEGRRDAKYNTGNLASPANSGCASLQEKFASYQSLGLGGHCYHATGTWRGLIN